MSENSQDSRYDWSQYYKFSAAWPSRGFLYRMVKRFDSAGFAIDLGCGRPFCGDFFGRRHAWADSEKMTFHSKEDVLALCEER